MPPRGRSHGALQIHGPGEALGGGDRASPHVVSASGEGFVTSVAPTWRFSLRHLLCQREWAFFVVRKSCLPPPPRLKTMSCLEVLLWLSWLRIRLESMRMRI